MTGSRTSSRTGSGAGTVDRPAAIRSALRRLVAERGFHGTSMAAVAKEAGVATGTAYVHYESKEELVYAAFLEAKADLAAVVLADDDPADPPIQRWHRFMSAAHDHLRTEPELARFLTQMEESPYYAEAYLRLAAAGDRLLEMATSPELADLRADMPIEVIYALSLGVVVRLAAGGAVLDGNQLDELIAATWRAVTRPA